MTQAGGLNQGVGDPEALGKGPSDLRHLDRVSHSRAEEIRGAGGKNLCLALEPSKSNAVDDPRSIPLENAAHVFGVLPGLGDIGTLCLLRA
jgi:hypothetical protein